MFLNKTKEQLGPDKANAPSFPHPSGSATASPHYPTAVLAIPGSVDGGGGVRVVPKQEGGGGAPGGGGSGGVVGGHLHQSHTSQNITVVPVPSSGIMTAGQWAPLSLTPPPLPPLPPDSLYFISTPFPPAALSLVFVVSVHLVFLHGFDDQAV